MNKALSILLVCTICNIAVSSFGTMAVSNIGTEWTKCPENPVLEGYLQPWVIYDGNIFKMWCSSSPGLVAYDFRISYFISSDSINWAFNSIVQEKGEPGSWDDYGVQRPLVQFDGSIYKMWYLGYQSGGSTKVGYATSLDGISWIKNTSPVLTPGNNGGWDDWSISDFTVVFNGTFYRMWYAAQRYPSGPQATGVATSFDGILWTKYSGNPVLTSTPGNWDSEHVYAGPTIFNGSHYLMWYTGQPREHPASIGLATSEDGFSWTKYEGNPVLSVGPSGSWESEYVISSCILERDDGLMMWYTAACYQPTETIGIGLAISYAPCIVTEVDIDPDTLNLRSQGKWITAYTELPEGYTVADIDVSTTMLNGTIPVDASAPTCIGDHDTDGLPDLMVKFDRAQVSQYILDHVSMTEQSMRVTLTVTGKLNDGTPFQGSDTITVLVPIQKGRQGIYPK